jgi:hypothetical protein
MNTILLLLLLELKHWYADFKIQTYAQTVRKGIYQDPIGISHSLDHLIGTLVVLFVFSMLIQPISPGLAVVLAVVEAIIHYHIDWTKVKFGCGDPKSPKYWNHFGLDQMAHKVCYLLMAYSIVV